MRLYDAVGIRLCDLPMTAEKVLTALEETHVKEKIPGFFEKPYFICITRDMFIQDYQR
jgi:hypothetical protein